MDHTLDRKHLKFSFKIAKAFHKLQKPELKNQSLEQALRLTETFEVPLDKVNGFCRIAKCYHEMGDSNKAHDCLTLAENVVKNLVSNENLALAHLILARTHLSLENSIKMGQALKSEPLYQFQQNVNIPFNTDELNTLGEFVNQIVSDGKVLLQFQHLAERLTIKLDHTVKSLANTKTKAINSNQSNKLKSLLSIAGACQILGEKFGAQVTAGLAFQEMQNLAKESIEKVDPFQLEQIIKYFSYKESSHTIEPMLQLLEQLYAQASFGISFGSSCFDKNAIASLIRTLYKNGNLTEKSDAFSEKYLSDCLRRGREPFDVINGLVCYGADNKFSSKQIIASLEAAEKLLPNLSSTEYPLAASSIAKAHLSVDIQKSLKFIAQYQNSEGTKHYLKGTKHYLSGVIVAAAMGLYISIRQQLSASSSSTFL